MILMTDLIATAHWEKGFEGFFHNKDPKKVAEEIYSISGSEEEPTKAQIVEKARDETSELHDLFEWNDSVAAEKWREDQAGHILRTLKVTFVKNDAPQEKREPIPVRLFYGNPQKKEGFVSIVRIMGNEELYAQLLERAKAELQSLRKKYAMLQELAPVFEMIDEL